MNNHQATKQMIGYLYQVRYALFLLLNNDDGETQISIEKFDDVAFIKDENAEKMIQLKHHVNQRGDLSNASTDIWRTINVWSDLVMKYSTCLENTKFIIITTAIAEKGTAAYYLRQVKEETAIEDAAEEEDDEKRNFEKAFKILENVANTSQNKKHERYYNSFKRLGENTRKKLIEKIYVIDGSRNIIDVEKDIRKMIKYCTLNKYEDMVCERLEGWWYKKSIEYLLSQSPVFINQNQLRSKIVEISSEYRDDNLPIDVSKFYEVSAEDLSKSDRIFYEQLKLICLSNERINLAISDYYRAFKQRANWIRNDLLFVNELDSYEDKLIDEWKREFYRIKEELDDLGDEEVTERMKIKKGKALYNIIEDKDIRIRERCSEAFVMRGSYHSLSNRCLLGWHIDFKERLKKLLELNEVNRSEELE